MNIDKKLSQLRIKWKKEPQSREIILRQVKAIKYSQQPYKFKDQQENEEFVNKVIENLI